MPHPLIMVLSVLRMFATARVVGHRF